jgi:hypothetical protein
LAEEKAKRDKEEAEKMKKKREEQQAKVAYTQWSKQCDTYFASSSRTTFQHPPTSICTCSLSSCVQEKQAENSLRACKHDIEVLLRASGSYDLQWLRTERLRWHPDKFGQKCHPDFRKELVKKTTQMYVIYEQLIAVEIEKTGGSA